MDCPACGQAIGEEDPFCKHCGGRVVARGPKPRSATVQDMVAEYRSSLADKPNDPNVLYNLGLGHLYSGHYDAAVEAFCEVIRLAPEEAPAYEKLAVALVKLNRRDEALEHARQAHRLDPERESILRLLRAIEG